MTTALAIWGAVLATATAIAQLASFWRDRPRIHVELSCNLRWNQPPTVIVTVSNRGRQATTIKKVALVAAAGDWTIGDGPDAAPFRPEIDLSEGRVALVEPGGIARFGLELQAWPHMFFAETPLRSYVIDSHNRRTWGPAAAILRMMLNSGVPAPPGTDPRFLKRPPDYEPETPDPVEPMWKLWKPKWQRRPPKPPRSSPQVPRTPEEERERNARREASGIRRDDPGATGETPAQHES